MTAIIHPTCAVIKYVVVVVVPMADKRNLAGG